MEKRRILYTQPTIEASTKLHPEKPFTASWFVRTRDLFIDPPQLTRKGRRSAINMIFNDWNVDSRPPRRMHSEAWPASLEVAVRRSPEKGYPCAMLNSMALARAG